MLELKYDYHSIEAGCDEAGGDVWQVLFLLLP